MRLPKITIQRDFITRAVMFVTATVLLFLAIPSAETEGYEYSVGKPWNYDALVATVDIELFRDADQQKQLEDSMKANADKVYYRNDDVAHQVIEEFTEALSSVDELRSAGNFRRRLIDNLRQIYAQGIIALDENDGQVPATVSLRTSNNGRTSNKPTSSFYTFASAHNEMQELLASQPELQKPLSDISISPRPNILLDTVMTNKEMRNIEAYARSPIGIVPSGQTIIDRGATVTARTAQIISTYEKKLEKQGLTPDHSIDLSHLGAVLVIASLMMMIYTYIYNFRPDYYKSKRIMLLLTILVVAFTAICSVLNGSFEHGIYMVPVTIVPIMLVVFLDSRTAFFTYLTTILLCAVISHYMWDFILLQTLAGFVAMASIRELSKRSQLLTSALMIFATYAVGYMSIVLMTTGHLANIESSMLGALAINALLISFAYVLIFLVEKTFGFISRVTLVELSDINHPLLRELSQECPGTFQHSMAVSNLAAAAAAKIGANTQLVRTGALYHDIGKASNPAFFTENQHGINPHEALTPQQSARIVIDHVNEGLRKAEKAKLPSRLRDFITEHHGRGKARYFYNTYCNQHPGEEVSPEPFTYPGPNPRSAETSIMMMADAVEAASRSLKEHTPEAIKALVDKIVDTQVAEGLHNDSPISFRDITEIKQSFESSLRTMYHSRISYPELSKPSV